MIIYVNGFLIGCIIGLLIVIVRLSKDVQKLKEEIYSFDNK